MMRRTLKTAGLMTILTLSFVFNSANAFEDGGGRSVFAHGAGERGLALGGAYSALANDASAMIWNPAGLARIERNNLYASHTDLIGMGFSEQLGLLAYPSWKLGTIGIGYRRFSVDGIEGRDDRGAIFSDNLQDAETELLLGYGRNFGGIWDLGMTVKYQQHSLAGHSDGAPGMDFGLMVKPLQALGRQSSLAKSLSLAVAIRNLIEPNIRLDEEGVKDPTGLRFGLGYESKISKNLHLVLSSDIEKTRDMDTRIHAGGEINLFDLLSLRAGSNASTMTAGLGVRVKNMALDYAFEDNPIETVHRFGLGIALGKSTAEKEQESLAAQEAELQKILIGAFLKENENRIHTIIGQAERAMDDHDFETALNKIETAKVLDPNFSSLLDLEGEIYFGQGMDWEKQNNLASAAIAYQRCLVCTPGNTQAKNHLDDVKAQSNRIAARSDDLRNQFEVSLVAYAQGEFIKAKNGFTRILEINPGDQEAAALLKSTLQTLELRAESLIEQARALALSGDFGKARGLLEQVNTLSPGHAKLAKATAFVNNQEALLAAKKNAARKAARKVAEKSAEKSTPVAAMPVLVSVPSYNSLSAKEKREITELYSRGMESVESNNHDDAIRYWELVWSKAPDFQQVAENLKQEYLDKGMDAFAEGRLDQSIEIWEKARSVAPDDVKIQGYLARAYNHNSRIQEIKGSH